MEIKEHKEEISIKRQVLEEYKMQRAILAKGHQAKQKKERKKKAEVLI